MAVNTIVMSGEVKRLMINDRSAKGPSALMLLQYGPSRERTNQPIQFLNVALIRVPHYVYERCHAHLKVGSLVDITGRVQGILKPMVSEGYITNELVATRVEVVDSPEEDYEDDLDSSDFGRI